MINRIVLLLLGTMGTINCAKVEDSLKQLSSSQIEATLVFNLKKGEYLYKESLLISCNVPSIKLTPLETMSKTTQIFDELYKKQKEVYTGTVTFKTLCSAPQNLRIDEPILHLHYALSTDSSAQEKIIKLPFSAPKVPLPSPVASKPVTAQQSTDSLPYEPNARSIISIFFSNVLNTLSSALHHTRSVLGSLFSHTGSRMVRTFSALLLGLLLSLTPCIYPMIPITIGILQSSGTSSALRNFLLALSYTLGISTTFALLGLLASLGSIVFGELQGSPYILLPLSVILALFGLSMFDFFQIPIPRWLQPKPNIKGGSYRSAFIFGAITGTVASPCLSPGLVLILNYVASITSTSFIAYLEGFLLLFIFGIGSSLPLLIIGTFSGSLALLPRAGAWMIEVKKIVGIMLIAMALYHLSHLENLFPWHIFIWFVMATFLLLGLYYFISLERFDSRGMRLYKNGMGVLLVVIGCSIAVQGQRALIEHLFPEKNSETWLHDYTSAFEIAEKNNTLLFIDIGATYCSSCKSLDKKIFKHPKINAALKQFTLLKIEADIHTDAYEKAKANFGSLLQGYPTYLFVDPKTRTVIKKWSVEIDQSSIENLAQELHNITKEHNSPVKV